MSYTPNDVFTINASTNTVTSDGIYNALISKIDKFNPTFNTVEAMSVRLTISNAFIPINSYYSLEPAPGTSFMITCNSGAALDLRNQPLYAGYSSMVTINANSPTNVTWVDAFHDVINITVYPGLPVSLYILHGSIGLSIAGLY